MLIDFHRNKAKEIQKLKDHAEKNFTGNTEISERKALYYWRSIWDFSVLPDNFVMFNCTLQCFLLGILPIVNIVLTPLRLFILHI